MPLPSSFESSALTRSLYFFKTHVKAFIADYQFIRPELHPPEVSVLDALNRLANTMDVDIKRSELDTAKVAQIYKSKLCSIESLKPQAIYEKTVVAEKNIFRPDTMRTDKFDIPLAKEMDRLINELKEEYPDRAVAAPPAQAALDAQAMMAQITAQVTSQLQTEMEAQKKQKFEEGKTAGAKENMALVRQQFTEFMKEPAVATALRAMKSDRGFLALMGVGDDAPAKGASDESKASSAAFFRPPPFASDQLKELLTPRKYELVMALSRSVTKSTDLRPDDIQISLAKLLIARLTLHCCDRSAVEIVNELIDALSSKIDLPKEQFLSTFPQLTPVINSFLQDGAEERLDTLSSEDYVQKLNALRDIVKVEWADFLADGSAANCLMREALEKQKKRLGNFAGWTEENYTTKVMSLVSEWYSARFGSAPSANPNP